jgi:hypothetical protein
MRFATYRSHLGSLQMMGEATCLDVIRELGRTFAASMAEIDKPVNDKSDLMNGLAAYHLLKLEGENARLDAAHRLVIKLVTDAAFDMAQDMARA